MLQKLRNRLYSEEKGFTLIELLVVILIIGILAAIALPAFLGQRSKGQDASAKSNARNAVSEVESCYTDQSTYTGCDDLTGSGIPNTTVAITTGGVGFTATSTSASGNTFSVAKASNGSVPSRTCTVTGGTTKGSCPTGLTW